MLAAWAAKGDSMRQFQWLRSLLLLAGLAVLISPPLWPQRRNPFGTRGNPWGMSEPNFPNRSSMTRRMIKASHEELQKEVAELAKKSAELQEQIKTSTEDELPLDALKKAEEIEKLAKKIQGRIKHL